MSLKETIKEIDDIKENESTLMGRFKDREFELSWDAVVDRYRFSTGTAVIETNASTHEIRKGFFLGKVIP